MRFLYPLARRFIAGHDFESAKRPIQKLMDEGYQVSINYVGEESKTIEDCRRASAQYLKIIKFFKNKKIDISIKPTQLGMLIHPYFSYIFVYKIAKAAAKEGHTIRLDMEDTNVTELTRNLAISLNKKFKNVGIAIQANLHRTKTDADHLIDHDVSMRLVKGAYKGDLSTEDTLRRFYSLAWYLKARNVNNPVIATHDEHLLGKIDDKFYDYEFLYGVRRDIQKNYLERGRTVRIYIPFGERWLPYTLRRLKEFKNLKFIFFNVVKEWFKS